MRRARTRALVRHARAVDTIFAAQEMGGRASPEQVQELHDARKVFEDVRPHGSHDAEAAYKKNPELATEAATGRTARAIRALQLETEMLANRKRDLGIGGDIDSGRSLGRALVFTHGLDLGRGRGIGI